jgi:hypothetical protein
MNMRLAIVVACSAHGLSARIDRVSGDQNGRLIK